MNRAGLSEYEVRLIEEKLGNRTSIGDVVNWLNKTAEGVIRPAMIVNLVIQDEFSHDLVVRWDDALAIVYGTT